MRLKVIITELQHNDLVREDLLAHLLTGLGQLRHDFGVVPDALQHRKRQGIVIALLCNFCGGTDPLEKAYLCQRVPNSAPFSFSGAVCVVDRVLSKLHQLTVVMAQGEV